ncbi:superfamily I DNA/RNA helicase [Pseudanabaenaceae cyanobacterium LEGE 13415]|nr:superfamily I DNA/RNA helicase [Pseudanabaenaceae cyanobacterium LEGE 13415]
MPILLAAQREYLRLDDLVRVEIERGQKTYQRIFDQGVQIVENKLMLLPPLFTSLKQRCQQYSNSDRNEGNFALAFPVVQRVKGKGQDQKHLFYPAFVLDISSIFQGNYRGTGWDLSQEFQILPIAPNLIEYFGLQEPEVESLIVTEGIHRFLQDAFKRPFPSIRDFILQVDLPDNRGCSVRRSPYLVRLNLKSYNTLLREDLCILEQSLNQPDLPVWYEPGHPVTEYLFGVPEPPREDFIFWAAAPGIIPDSYQAAALKHSEDNRLTTVLGGPGSGKTELSFNLIAQQIWKRAHAQIHNDVDLNNLCTFAATTNSAIDKFTGRLNTKISSPLFYLPGGKQKVIREECLPKLRSAIEHLQSIPYDVELHAQAKQIILDLESQLNQAVQQNHELQDKKQHDRELLSSLNSEIETLEQSIANVEILQNQYAHLNDFSDFPHAAYEEIQKYLEQAWKELPCEDDPWGKRATDWLGVVSDQTVFQRLAHRVFASCLHTQSFDRFRFTVPLNREQLESARLEVARLIDAFERWQAVQDQKAKNEQEIEDKREILTALEGNRRIVQERFGQYPSDDFYDRFYQEHHDLQVQLFQRSWEFLQQEALLRRDEIVTTLRIYEGALIGNEEALGEIRLNAERFFTRLSLVFPVLSSTLQSLATLLPLKPDLISLAILDEAGATPLHQALPLLARAWQAVVLGDPKQIEPIINLCPDTVQEYCKQSFLDRGLSFQDYERYAPTAKDSATAFHRAAGASGESGDLGKAIVLRNHYRSVPSIISFCSPNYPDGLNILTSDRPSALGPNLIAYPVQGVIQNRVNSQEIQAIKMIVDDLLGQGYTADEIGVLSPFFHQASALRSQLRERWRDFSYYSIGTVHDFQGGEKPVIILSPFQCDRDFLNYINRRSNLLNTAVSRAEELFILVGNLEELESSGETRRLVRHCRQYGEIRSLRGDKAT